MKITTILKYSLAVGVLAGAATLATSAPANAHTPEASATCSTLTVALSNYEVGTDGSLVNSLTVEIDSAVVDGKQSVILPQVTFGIAVRMAVMSIVAGNEA